MTTPGWFRRGWRLLLTLLLRSPLCYLGALWIEKQRRTLEPEGRPLDALTRTALNGFFDRDTLECVRTVAAASIEEPRWLGWVRRLGLPMDFTLSQAAGVTYGDLILVANPVTQDNPSVAKEPDVALLFHELVHVVQYRALGLHGFLHTYVGGWIAADFRYLDIPLEIEAYRLEERFRTSPSEMFSVEAEIRERLRSQTVPEP
ncbi:MAG: DUF4157 domain-containing protein [Thermoanaerobaculia bacterium]|nr:DUF4157 domain-containing protein [Thermoanaerobaculia bacterium]